MADRHLPVPHFKVESALITKCSIQNAPCGHGLYYNTQQGLVEMNAMESFGIRIYKEYFNFAAAHFLIFADGTREELHGHNYHVQFEIEGTLDTHQDVFIDFLHIKPLVKRVCDEIDHRTLFPQGNPHLKILEGDNAIEAVHQDGSRWVIPKRDVVLMPLLNTSAERLAQFIGLKTLGLLSQQYPQAMIQHVVCTVEESKGQCALYRQHYAVPTPLVDLVAVSDKQAVLCTR